MISLKNSDRLFVLTGAGISAESGIPTFRDAKGLWQGWRFEEVASPEAWARDPQLVWKFYSMRRAGALPCKPNPAHGALAELERKLGDRFFLCTQNVDNLHEQAGSRRLVHMHGELFKSRCDTCARAPFEDTKGYEGVVPRCECGGKIRPHIVWFGEVPFEMDRIADEIDRCSVLAVIGTSGVVHPAASFVHWAREKYAAGGEPVRTVYVGPEEPANRSAFDECVLGKAGEVLPGLFEVASSR
ncbi:MAG TPA: NAD-dependent deacylase [Terriglobales bacterium]